MAPNQRNGGIEKTRVQHDALEARRLFAAYAFAVVSDLDSATGTTAQAPLVADAQGDLFGVTTQGGSQSGGTLFELPAGLHVAAPIATFGGMRGQAFFGGLVKDQAGDLFGTIREGGQSGVGTIFELPVGGTVADYAAFPSPSTSGLYPFRELVLKEPTGGATGPLIYGVTQSGGVNSDGTIFQVSGGTSPQVGLVVNFPNGIGELGTALALDSTGNLFGTTTHGGPQDAGTIFEAPAGGGVFLSKATFCTATGSNPQSALLLDTTTGAFYGVAENGGANGDGTIYKYADGTITALASFDGTHGSAPEGALVEDAWGNLFGTTTTGGLNNLGTVFELPAGENKIITLVSFDGANTGKTPVGGLMMNGSGNLYGVTESGGANGDGVIYQLTPFPATQLQFSSAPQPAHVGRTLGPITVNLDDADGNLAVRDDSVVTLTLTGGSAGATLGGTVSVPAVDGVATFSDLSISAAGQYTIAASDGTLTCAGESIVVDLPASQLQFAAQPVGARAGQVLAPVVVDVENSAGNIVADDNSTVTLSATGLGGTLSVQAVDGVATFDDLTCSTAGTITLTAGDAAVASAASNPFVIAPLVPRIEIAGRPAAVVSAGARVAPITIDLLDADGAVETTSRPTKVVISTSDPRGRHLAFIGVARRGVAVFKTLAFKFAGSYTLHVTAGTFQAADTDAFTVTAAAARRILFSIQPATTPHDVPFTAQAELFDQFGNIATNDTSTATIAFQGRVKLAMIGGPTTAVFSGGIATFSDVSIDVPARAYILRVFDGRLHAISKRFAIS